MRWRDQWLRILLTCKSGQRKHTSWKFVLFSELRKGLFTPWTMKSSQGHVIYVIGCWTHPGTTMVYTKTKKCQSVHGKKGLTKTCFKASIIHRHGPTGFAVVHAWQRDVVIKYFSCNVFWGREDDDKRMVKIYLFIYFKFAYLGAYIGKINTFIFWCMVIPLGPHSVYA